MEMVIKAAVFGLFAAIVYPIICTLFGAISGWAIGLFFEDTIRETLGWFEVNPPVTFWQMGATLGFISGYFKSVYAGGN